MSARRESAANRPRARALLAAACCALAAALQCAGQPPQAAVHLDGVRSCEYRVRVESVTPLRLAVDATCEGLGVRGLEADDARVASWVAPVSSDEGPVTRRGASFLLARAQRRAHFHYRVDLERVAAKERDFDLALRSGRSLIAPASSYLLYPLPLDVGTPVRLFVTAPDGLGYATGLSAEGDHYRLDANEIPVATYSVFGAVSSEQLRLPGAHGDTRLDLVILDGELGVGRDELAAWVRSRARAVADFYGAFPAPRVTVMVIPAPGRRDVVFGKLLPESAPGVALLVGSDAGGEALANDWVLIHELFHIGVPSFSREGKWFDEGLATYFEPLIRVRAGFWDEKSAWQSFALEMPRGAAALTRDGLEHARNYPGIYWGGAIYCLLADVDARERSGGALGLEDGIRRVFAAGGRSWDVWPLSKTLATADASYEAPLLTPLAQRYADTPHALDLEALFTSLGVERRASGFTLSDAAPRSWVRRAITFGHAGAQPARRK